MDAIGEVLLATGYKDGSPLEGSPVKGENNATSWRINTMMLDS